MTTEEWSEICAMHAATLSRSMRLEAALREIKARGESEMAHPAMYEYDGGWVDAWACAGRWASAALEQQP